jgi:hypothetical protein
MPLTSPGVEVIINDQSQYLPAPTASVPLVVFATAQDKKNPSGTGIARGTTAANAGKLFQATSQRDLVSLYGTPVFQKTSDGTPIQGDELNEYGLFAAFSALGVTNRVYCLRAPIDLASLKPATGRPAGKPDDGAYWLDTTTSTWGIYQWNATTETFAVQTPIVITDADNTVSGAPLGSIGSIGSYAVIALQATGSPDASTSRQFFYKNANNTWVELGSEQWYQSIPYVVGTNSNPVLTAGNTFTITANGGSTPLTSSATITVPGLGSNTVAGVASAINSLNWAGVTASVNSSGRLQLFMSSHVSSVVIAAGTGTVLDDIGIAADTYYTPLFYYGTSADQPLWGADQTYPRATGSVWLKIGAAGSGLVSSIKVYDAVADAWVSKTVTMATSDAAATVDAPGGSTGGSAIPKGTIYGQYDFNTDFNQGPIYYFKRLATGPTVITGTNTDPSFTAGAYTARIFVSVPNSAVLSGPYVMTLADNTDAADFVEAWQAAAVPYTTAAVLTDGSIQITHTLGGSIQVNDALTTGVSSGLMAEAGFVINSTTGVKYGDFITSTFAGIGSSSTSSLAGAGAQFTITKHQDNYNVTAIVAAGTNYIAGDTLTFNGSALGGITGANDLILTVASVNGSGGILSVAINENSDTPAVSYQVELSNWVEFEYTANQGAPTETPANLTNWFYAVANQVDIMVNTTGGWKGYRNVAFNSNGFPLPSGSAVTDPNGPICSGTAPTVNSEGDPLVYGDLWVDTSDTNNYPKILRWQSVQGEDKWVLIDNTDQVSGSGILFADARWSSDQDTINPANDPVPTIVSLLSSNNLDLDAPSNSNYPVGMLLFNTRRSGNNVKQWRNNYFNATDFPDETLPTIRSTWVSASGLQQDGSPYMGYKAQRNMVVKSLRSVIDTNQDIRDEDNFFNLMATPNYPECATNMVGLNAARGETVYIIGDTPMRLPDDATAIQAYATAVPADGGPARNTYLGLFYPSGLATDLEGNEVAVSASHFMLRTFLRNDTIAYPWLAAAGTRRGLIDNAVAIGYLNSTTGEFVNIKTRIGIRDVLYINFINPLVFFTGNGFLNYGNKTSFNSQSALDRTNVARLVAYVRRQLTIAARPFVFEPNDALTRQQISGVVESLMVDLVAKRGIYDYLVVCDESNNTPARIDRNELWIDVALEPVKAAEFIYIPVRIDNTGALSGA